MEWLEGGFWPTAKLIWLARTCLIGRWWALRDPIRVLWACRAPALSVVIGGGLIAMTDQARDIVIASAIDESGFWGKLGLIATMLMWASVSWYWARITLNFSFALTPVDTDDEAWAQLSEDQRQLRRAWRAILVTQMPRMIGAVAIFAVAWSFHSAAEVYAEAPDSTKAMIFSGWADNFLMLAIAFYALVAARTPILTFLLGREPIFKSDQPPSRMREILVPGPAAYTRLRQYANPVTAMFVIGSAVLSPVMFAWYVLDPVGISAIFGGPVRAVLFGLATLVPVVSILALLSGRLRFPVLGGVILWMAVSGSLAGDNHDVRTLNDVAERQHIDTVFEAWWATNAKTTKPVAPGVTAPPAIFVATAGGASRAAYWTAQVLGEIAAREPHFHERLFLISGVSGGSLGAATFRSQVTAHRAAGGDPVIKDAASASKAFLKADFLTAAMAAGVYVDLPLHAFPWARFDDRAAALEKAWEEAWAATFLARVKGSPSWESGFVSTFAGKPGDPPWPILMLNGTSVEKGKRIVTTNVRLHTRPAGLNKDLSGRLNRYDAFDILGKDIRISTAVTMSARFPIISPTGGMRTKVLVPAGAPSGTAARSEVATRVTDGGLYENFGAATADEALRYIIERRGDTRPDISGRVKRPVWPIVIVISSDPSLDPLDMTTLTSHPSIADCPGIAGVAKPKPRPQPGNSWNECPTDGQDRAAILVDPLLSLYTGRTARGEAAATALLDRIIENRRVIRDNLAQEIRAANDDADSVTQDIMLADMRRRLVTEGPADFFHFRQCRALGHKSPTMSWHDSGEAWSAMETMKGMTGDDPCGNGAEFRRLCMRLRLLTGEAADTATALAKCLEARWPRPR